MATTTVQSKRHSRTRLDALHDWLASAEWTEGAYFALPDTNYLVELSDGQLLVLEMPTTEHQWIVTELLFLMKAWAQEHGAGLVLVAPMPVRLWAGKIREPDIVFYAAGHEDRLHDQYADPPDLAVEVLSPTTQQTDRGEKSVEYAAAGVGEYWIVDPAARSITVCTGPGPEGYEQQRHCRPDDLAESVVLSGFTVRAADLIPSGPLTERSA